MTIGELIEKLDKYEDKNMKVTVDIPEDDLTDIQEKLNKKGEKVLVIR